MADTRVVLPACPCPIRARLRRLAPSYTFTGCLLPQAYGKGDTARDEDEYRVQASPTSPAKLLMLTQGMGRLKKARHDGDDMTSMTSGAGTRFIPFLPSLPPVPFLTDKPDAILLEFRPCQETGSHLITNRRSKRPDPSGAKARVFIGS